MWEILPGRRGAVWKFREYLFPSTTDETFVDVNLEAESDDKNDIVDDDDEDDNDVAAPLVDTTRTD